MYFESYLNRVEDGVDCGLLGGDDAEDVDWSRVICGRTAEADAANDRRDDRARLLRVVQAKAGVIHRLSTKSILDAAILWSLLRRRRSFESDCITAAA